MPAKALEWVSRLPLKGDGEAHPLSHEFDNWLEQYDAIEEVSIPKPMMRSSGWTDVLAGSRCTS